MSYWADLVNDADASARTHGKRATYKHGCRCRKCTAANRVYHRNRWRVTKNVPLDRRRIK